MRGGRTVGERVVRRSGVLVSVRVWMAGCVDIYVVTVYVYVVTSRRRIIGIHTQRSDRARAILVMKIKKGMLEHAWRKVR